MRLLVNEPPIKTGQLSALQCPVLVIGGDNDVIKPEHTT
jgi:pimeloyl-ACP methyl ester carboxylesterase